MLTLKNRAVAEQYERFHATGDLSDPYETPESIGVSTVLDAHFLLCDAFAEKGEGIGGIGPKSLDLLHSAVGRQLTEFNGVRKYRDVYERAATLLYGLIKNHPFYDANKRTALLATLVLLNKHKLTPTISHKELDKLVIAVADNSLHDFFSTNAALRKARTKAELDNQDVAVAMIARYLKSSCRRLNHGHMVITYNVLATALRRKGFELANPSGNFIDIVRVEPSQKKFFGKNSTETVHKKLGQIGYPGGTKQVGAAALKTVREVTGMDARHGYDADAFLQDAEPIHVLLEVYSEPLRRLANK